MGLALVACGAVGQESPIPVLRYRTVDTTTHAIAFDVHADAIVELKQVRETGPSVIQSVGNSTARRVIWSDEGDTTCGAGQCGMGIEYAPAIDAYVVRVASGHQNHIWPKVYVSRDAESCRLIARTVSIDGESAAYRVRRGVLEVNGWIASSRVMPGTREIVLAVERPRESPRRYVIKVPVNWRTLEAGIRVREATADDVPPVESIPPASSMNFQGCGADPANYYFMGSWLTLRGTAVYAIGQAVVQELNGRPTYGGVAQCLYEVKP